jgi:hypothetical protein
MVADGLKYGSAPMARNAASDEAELSTQRGHPRSASKESTATMAGHRAGLPDPGATHTVGRWPTAAPSES